MKNNSPQIQFPPGLCNLLASTCRCLLLAVLTQSSWAQDCAITGPALPTVPSVATVYKPGAALNVTGNAGGADFRSFQVQWARGLNPATGWTNTGIVLTGGGISAVADALLATWNSDSVTQADFYSIRLRVDNTTVTNQTSTYVHLEPDLFSPNWPCWLDQSPGDSSLQPVHLAGGQTRLALVNPPYLSTSVPSRLWQFEADGSSYATDELDHGSYMQPAVGNVDDAAGDEVIVAEWNQLRVYREDGSHSVLSLPVPSNLQHALVSLADLDGDGQLEVLALGSVLSGTNGWLYAWNAKGEMFDKYFPIPVPDANGDLRSMDRRRVIPVDMDADGLPELLVVAGENSSQFSLRLFRADGTPANWPTNVLTGQFFMIAAGDLDGDGLPEIAVAYADGGGVNRLMVYSTQGTPRAGWPKAVGSGTPMRVLMADLNRDGTNEIIATAFAGLFVFKPDGTSFPGTWPVQGNGFQPFSMPVVGDIDGDGIPEILAVRSNHIFTSPEYGELTLMAYRTNGSLARSWRLFGANGNQPTQDGPPLLGDFDGDGNVDVAVNYRVVSGGGTSGSLHEGVVTVLRLDAPFHPNPRDWPMYHHDARNSSAGFMPAKLKLNRAGSDLVLSWPLQPDVPTLQSRDDLKSNQWNALTTPVVLNYGMNTATFTSTNTQRWFRLQYP